MAKRQRKYERQRLLEAQQDLHLKEQAFRRKSANAKRESIIEAHLIEQFVQFKQRALDMHEDRQVSKETTCASSTDPLHRSTSQDLIEETEQLLATARLEGSRSSFGSEMETYTADELAEKVLAQCREENKFWRLPKNWWMWCLGMCTWGLEKNKVKHYLKLS